MRYISLVISISYAVFFLKKNQAEEHHISQKGKIFAPGEITIHTGDTIVFQNDDEVTHHVFSMTSGMKFNSEPQIPGGSETILFTTEKRSEVRCIFHPIIRLTVVVTKLENFSKS